MQGNSRIIGTTPSCSESSSAELDADYIYVEEQVQQREQSVKEIEQELTDTENRKEGSEKEVHQEDQSFEITQLPSHHSLCEMPNSRVTIQHDKEPTYTDNNSSWIKPGRVITVSPQEGGDMSSRTMLVMAKSGDNALQCLSLCTHPEMTEDYYADSNFSGCHVPVFGRDANPREVKQPFKTQVIIALDKPSSKLPDECWINCEHVWTVRSIVNCCLEGKAMNFEELLPVFLATQRKLYQGL